MLEALRKKALKSTLAGAIILMIIGVGLIIFMGPEMYYGIVGYVPFEKLGPDDLGHQMVDVKLTLNWGAYRAEGTKNTSTGRKTINYYYYVIGVSEPSMEDFRYMAIKVPAKYHSDLEDMSKNTFEGYYSEPVYLSGQVRKLTGENYDHFKKTFLDDGWTEEEIAEGTVPYYIQVDASKSGTITMGCVVCGLGLVFIIIGIILIWRAAAGATLKDFKNAISEAGYTETMVESDYNAAQSYNKKGDLKIGRLFVYYMASSKPIAIPTNKMMWTYQTTTTHRTNGIKTGTTYSIMIYVEGRKNCYTLSVPNEATAHTMLDKINNTFPWVVVGYTDEIRNLFNKDRSQFLSLRYNTVEHVAVDEAFAYNQEQNQQI